MENQICGLEEKEIRKYYFQKKVPAMLSKIQESADIEPEELKKLEEFLAKLQDSEKTVADRVIEVFGGKILGIEEGEKVPTTEALYNDMTNEDKLAWQENVDKAKKQISIVRSKMAEISNNHKQIKQDEWADAAIIIESLKRWVAQEYIYFEQLFKKKICDIIDDFECSRAEAQNRAEVSKEYSDYKNSLKEYESLSELVLLYKKRAGLN